MKPYARTVYLALMPALIVFALLVQRCSREEPRFEIHGTVGRIPVFIGPSSIGDSATSEVGGALNLGAGGLKFNGPLVIGPASGNPSLQSGTAASIAITQTTHVTLPSWVSVNLTAVTGVIDWATPDNSGQVPSCIDGNLPSRILGAHVLACGVKDIVQPNVDVTVQNGTCGGACTFQMTWTATDASTTIASGTNNFHGTHVYNQAANPFGMAFAAPAGPSQLVLRQYLQAFAATGVTCTATLTDSYGVTRTTVSTTPFSTPVGDATWFVNEWTYVGVQVGDQFRVVCLITPDVNPGYGNAFTWFGETLSPT